MSSDISERMYVLNPRRFLCFNWKFFFLVQATFVLEGVSGYAGKMIRRHIFKKGVCGFWRHKCWHWWNIIAAGSNSAPNHYRASTLYTRLKKESNKRVSFFLTDLCILYNFCIVTFAFVPFFIRLQHSTKQSPDLFIGSCVRSSLEFFFCCCFFQRSWLRCPVYLTNYQIKTRMPT